MIVAVVVALAVPVSQLRTISTSVTCCCPDQTRCHCPHEKPGQSDEPTMKPCHKVQHDVVGPQLPSFSAPELAIALAAPRAAAAPFAVRDLPHAPPVPDEPYGPS